MRAKGNVLTPTMAVVFCVFSLTAAWAQDGEMIGAKAQRSFPRLGLEVELRKMLDPETGVYEVRARTAGGALVNLASLEAAERRLTPAGAGKLHPSLADKLAAAPGRPQEIVVWLRFDPRDLDFARHVNNMRSAGISESAVRADVLQLVTAANGQVVMPAKAMMENMGLQVKHADAVAPFVCTVASRAQIEELARLHQVARIFASTPLRPSLVSARGTHRWDRVFDFGLRGDGVRLGVVEVGKIDAAGTSVNVVATHIPAQPIAPHITQVASVAASDDAARPGYARGAEVLNANSDTGVLGDFVTACNWAAGQGAAIMTTSANIDDASLTLTAWDYYVDYFVRYLRVTFTVSASNSGLGSGSVKSPGLAWNVITVGAADDAGNADWSDDFMANYSSWHDPISPQGDREKPELVAIGSNLSIVGPGGASQVVSGTSFSTPSTAGMITCLLQAAPSLIYNPETVKALMMATATHNIEGASRLSDRDGAGCINGLQALRAAENDRYTFDTFYPSSFNNNGAFTYDIFLQGGDEARVVLCWNSDADAAYTMDALDADLDLAIRQGQGNTTGLVLASSSSWDNSYEIVEFCPPATGWYTINVLKFTFTGSSEPYGIAWTQHSDGRHVRVRTHHADDTAGMTGPSIGNNSFFVTPVDPAGALDPYVCVASAGTIAGIDVPGCRHFFPDLDLIANLSVTPGNGLFHDFIGTLNSSGQAPSMRVNIPNYPPIAGTELYLGLVTLNPAYLGNVKEISVVEPVRLQGAHTELLIDDDGSLEVALGFSFPFFGSSYTTCWVNANGNITFGGSDSQYNETITGMLNDLPRIAPFWDDLDPEAGGYIRHRSAGPEFVIEWLDVPEYGTTNQNSVIVTLRQDGSIMFKYRDCALQDAIVGVSPGGGTTAWPFDISHGSRRPDPLLYISPPAMFEEFTDGPNPFDLGVALDVRRTVRIEPTGYATGNYRVTVDFDE